MKDKNKFLVFGMFVLFLILLNTFISAGPYGYNDSMELTYEITCNGIVFKYGDTVKYETILNNSGNVNEVLCEEVVNGSVVNGTQDIPEGMLVSEVGVVYEERILGEFSKLNQSLNENFIEVIIDLKNISEMDNLFSTFLEYEIRNVKKFPLSSSIDAEITKEGFDKLINESRVDSIWFNAPAYAVNGDNRITIENETEKKIEEDLSIDEEIKKQEQIDNEKATFKQEFSLLWLWIIIAFIVAIIVFYLIIKLIKKREN